MKASDIVCRTVQDWPEVALTEALRERRATTTSTA
jgi:hypothetical protein